MRRAVRTEGGEGRIDQARVFRRQCRSVETQRGRGTRPQRLHEDVGAVRQPSDQRHAVRGAQVHRQRSFVAVVRLIDERHQRSGEIAAGGMFDLDDIRTEIGQQLRRGRARDGVGQIDNSKSG